MNRAGIDAKIAALKVEVEGIEDIDKKKFLWRNGRFRKKHEVSEKTTFFLKLLLW
jgi:preprotein translocase subunit SecA